LPDTIARLKDRLAGLSADQATTIAHARDPLTLNGRSGDAMGALTDRLDALPEKVRETRRFAFGKFRGLDFGLVLYPGGAADIYLEGEVNRHGQLSREHQGPRAVLNALDRMAGSYDSQCESTRSELTIAENQLRDHEARIGRAFPHDDYLRELTDLRDRLKLGLSRTTPEPGVETVAELAERIKSLKAAHTIDAAPARTSTRRIVAEEPVTARIRRRNGPKAETQPTAEPVSPGAEIAPIEAIAPATPTEPPSQPVTPTDAEMPVDARQGPAYRRQIDRERRQVGRQLSLF
jgi:hypothetical protein